MVLNVFLNFTFMKINKIKILIVLVFFLSNFNCFMAIDQKNSELNLLQEDNTDIKINENVDNSKEIEDLFNLEVSEPKLEEPSILKVWIREFGISLVYKYYALKAWIIKNIKKLSVIFI